MTTTYPVTVMYQFGGDVVPVVGTVESGPGAIGSLIGGLAVKTSDGVTEIPLQYIVRIDHFHTPGITKAADAHTVDVVMELARAHPHLLHTYLEGSDAPDSLEKVYDVDGDPWYRNGDNMWTDHDGEFKETWEQLLLHGPLTTRFIGTERTLNLATVRAGQ